MIITDKSGRKLKIGQVLDIPLFGVFQCKLVGIKDVPVLLSPTQQVNPHIIVGMNFTPLIHPDGYVRDVYIIGEPDPKDPLVLENEGRIKLVQ